MYQLHTQCIKGIYSNSVTLKSRLGVTEHCWKRHQLIDHIRFSTSYLTLNMRLVTLYINIEHQHTDMR